MQKKKSEKEHVKNDLKQSIDQLAPTGMPEFPKVDLDKNYQKTRHALSVCFDYSLSQITKISATLTHKPLPYTSMTETAAYLSFSSNGTLYLNSMYYTSN